MAKTNKEANSRPEMDYTNSMRVYGGLAWGSILAGAIVLMGFLIPQIPDPKAWSISLLWVGLVSLGVSLQWFVARGQCPKCGRELTIPPMLTKCPQCRSYLKAMNRKIVKVN